MASAVPSRQPTLSALAAEGMLASQRCRLPTNSKALKEHARRTEQTRGFEKAWLQPCHQGNRLYSGFSRRGNAATQKTAAHRQLKSVEGSCQTTDKLKGFERQRIDRLQGFEKQPLDRLQGLRGSVPTDYKALKDSVSTDSKALKDSVSTDYKALKGSVPTDFRALKGHGFSRAIKTSQSIRL